MAMIALTKAFSGSDIVTVLFGDGVRVVQPRLSGNRYYNHQDLVEKYPGGRLAAVCSVPCPKRPPLWAFAYSPTQSPRRIAVRAVLRWLTRGRVYSEDCCGQAIMCLRLSGVAVPRRITTPIALMRWCAVEAKGELKWLDSRKCHK